MIERVVVLNLPFRVDRGWYVRGHLRTIGVPRSRIELFPAKYGLDFENTEAVQAAAAADGFEFLNRYPSPDPSEQNHWAYIWNWCSILRSIEQGSGFTLVMLDDRILKMSFGRLCECVEFLNQQYPPFHALQLGWWLGVDSDIEVEHLTSFLGRGGAEQWGLRNRLLARGRETFT